MTEDNSPNRLRIDRWGFWPVATVLFVLAFAVRLTYLNQIRASPLFSLYLGDALSYHEWARSLITEGWLGDTVFYQAPLYPYVMGLVYLVFGEERWFILLVQILLGAASCVLLARAGWRFFSPAVGAVAGLILALYAPAIYFDGLVQKANLALFWLCLVLWLMGRLTPKSSAWQWGWLGVAVGALILTRENAVLLIVPLVAWVWTFAPFQNRRGVAAGSLLLGVALMLLPIALRNHAVGGEFHLTTSQFGPNFYIGNHAEATGIYQPLRPGRGSFIYERLDATELAQADLGRELTPGQVSRYWTRRTLSDITADPLGWLGLLGRKFVLAVNAIEIGDTEDQYTYAESSPLLRVAGTVGHFGFLVPLAVLGLILTWQRRERLLPIHWMLAIYLLSLLLFFVFARYRYPLVPFLVLLAAAGLVELPRLLKNGSHHGSRRQLAAVAGTLMAVAVFCNWPIFSKDRIRAITALSIAEGLVEQGDLDGALSYNQRATELDSDNPLALYNLGMVHHLRTEMDEAIRNYLRVLEVRPDYAPAAVNLGVALAGEGDLEGAIASFERALEIDPQHARARHNLELARQTLASAEP